ncbi:type IV pilus assembly protein PilM [Desulforamulus putei]|uniref:type IV pilus assembly protein PilM n=1 Tax=Desulforamulus putei TaxID=74701 RepID=UPI0009345C97|nr:type IV pilus assembly protein PilM [Desulforamulus putei]
MKKLLQKLLSRQQPCLTAIDIGSHTTKVMEIKRRKGLPYITALGSMPTPPLRDGVKLDEEELARVISRLVETAGVTGTEVITAISGSKVITRQIRVPVMPDAELQKTAWAEAKKHIPLPIEDLTVRYVKLGEESVDGMTHINLMLIAVPTALVEQVYHIFMMAGLKIRAVDLQAFALWRLFGKDQRAATLDKGNAEAVAVLEIGAGNSQLVIIKGGEIKFVRVMAAGGNAVIEAIAGHYRISGEEARQLTEETTTSFPARLQLDFYLRQGIDTLAREVERSLDFYCSQPGSVPVNNILLAGGTAKLTGLADYLTERWGIVTEIKIPDCWNNYILNDQQEALFEYDPAYAVALGLLMGEVEEHV